MERGKDSNISIMGRKDKKKKKQQRKKERQRTATKQCTGEQVSDSGGASYPVGATGGQSMPDDKTVEKGEDTHQSGTSNTTRPTLGSRKQGKDDQGTVTKQCTGEQVSDSGGASYPVGATGGQSMSNDKTVEKGEDTHQSGTSNTTRPTLGSRKQGKDDQACIKPIAPVAPAAALDSITSGSIVSSYFIFNHQGMNSRSTNSRDEDFAEMSYTSRRMEAEKMLVRGPPSGSRPRLKIRAYRGEEIELTNLKAIDDWRL